MTIGRAIEKIHMISSVYSHNREEQEALLMAADALRKQEQRGKKRVLAYLLYMAQIAGFCLAGGIAAAIGMRIILKM